MLTLSSSTAKIQLRHRSCISCWNRQADFQALSKHSLDPLRCGLLNLETVMRRRDFFGVLGSVAASWPNGARAQPSAIPVVGMLATSMADLRPKNAEAFHQGLSEGGYLEGRNLIIDRRGAGGRYNQLPGLANELFQRA
jgi:hypothetical protein